MSVAATILRHVACVAASMFAVFASQLHLVGGLNIISESFHRKAIKADILSQQYFVPKVKKHLGASKVKCLGILPTKCCVHERVVLVCVCRGVEPPTLFSALENDVQGHMVTKRQLCASVVLASSWSSRCWCGGVEMLVCFANTLRFDPLCRLTHVKLYTTRGFAVLLSLSWLKEWRGGVECGLCHANGGHCYEH